MNIVDVFHKIIIFHPFNYVEKQCNRMMKSLCNASSKNWKILNNKIMTHNNHCCVAITHELRMNKDFKLSLTIIENHWSSITMKSNLQGFTNMKIYLWNLAPSFKFQKKVTLTWHINRARYGSQFLLGIIGFQIYIRFQVAPPQPLNIKTSFRFFFSTQK